jgi:WD40 repeat protein
MNEKSATPYDYQSEGGALRIDSPTYVKRKADDELFEALYAGQLCYVLNARQMGKSSLKVRIIQRLQEIGIACAAVDLQGIGTSVTEEQWYVSVINRIARSLQIRRQFDLNRWWIEQHLLSYVQRFSLFIETVLLPTITQPIMILIDEVDLTLSLPFSSDDFFGVLRECYNRRADEPEFRRLTFVMFGVATPSDLIQNKQITPFNVGKPIELTGFQLEEAQPLLPGLTAKSNHPEALLQAVLVWTGGQPFLTQKVCKLILAAESAPSEGQEELWVGEVVHTKIIENWETQDTPPHLATIRDRLLGAEERAGRLLGLYQEIVQQGELIANDSPEQMDLRLTGLVVKRNGNLKVYNPIYAAVFNCDWLERELAQLRPYGVMISAWLKSGHGDESRLLRGDALQDALAWSEGKRLGDDDYRFLNASQELETREVQRRLATEAEANQILTEARQQAEAELEKANQTLVKTQAESECRLARAEVEAKDKLTKATQKARRRTATSWGFATVAIAVAAMAVPSAIEAKKARYTAQQDVQKLEQQRAQLTKDKEQLDNSLREVLIEEKAARARESRAQRQYQQAQEQAQSALAQYQQAQEQGRKVKVQLGQVNQAKAQAEQAAKKAQQQFEEAKQNLDKLAGLADEAYQKVLLADVHLQGSKAKEQFAYGDSLLALIESLRTGDQFRRLLASYSPTNTLFSEQEDTRIETIAVLYQAVYGSQERNRWEADVNSLDASSDGQTIVSGGVDGIVRLWDLNGRYSKTIGEHQSEIQSIKFSPDGQRIVSSSTDGMIIIWSVDGRKLNSFRAHSGEAVLSISFSPDGQMISSGGADGKVELWSRDGDHLRTLDGNQIKVWSVSFSPDGKAIISGGEDGTIKQWLLENGQSETIGTSEGIITSVMFHPDGEKVAVGDAKGDLKLLNLVERDSDKIFTGHGSEIVSVGFSKDGQTLMSGGADGTIKLWDADSKNQDALLTLRGHRDEVRGIVSRSDGQVIISGSKDSTIRVWDIPWQERRSPAGQESDISAFELSPDGETTASGLNNGVIKLGKLSQGNESHELNFESLRTKVWSLSFSPDSRTIASGDGNGVIALWNLRGQKMWQVEGHEGRVLSLDFSPDGKTLISGGSDHRLKAWNVDNQTESILLTNQDAVQSVSFNPEGTKIISGGGDGSIKLLNLDGHELWSLAAHQGSVQKLMFSPNGKMIVSSGTDGKINVWSLDGNLQHRLIGHQAPINSIDFNIDSRTLVSDSADGTIKVWNSYSGQELATVQVMQRLFFSKFSPIGNYIVVGGINEVPTFMMWDINGLMNLICEHTSNYLTYTSDKSVEDSDRKICGIHPVQARSISDSK